MQPRRDKAAAVKLMRRLLKKQGFTPNVVVTDKLRSYGAAMSEIGLSARHEQGLRRNNRAENSHQPAAVHPNAKSSLPNRGSLDPAFAHPLPLKLPESTATNPTSSRVVR